jgi:hypothetical protein
MDALADFVTIVHLAYFVFVIGGFIAIVGRRSKWVFNPWFRIVHLLSIWVVLAEDVIGFNCPLNVAESSLRAPETGGAEASSGFGYLLDQLLHHTIPERVLDACIGHWAQPRYSCSSCCRHVLRQPLSLDFGP